MSDPNTPKALAERRWQARCQKDFAASDRLREQLAEQGWLVRDRTDGYDLERMPYAAKTVRGQELRRAALALVQPEEEPK